jgi:hypothetical protein
LAQSFWWFHSLSFNNNIGKINLSCGTFTPVSGSFKVGTITFKTKSVAGKTSLTFDAKSTNIHFGGYSVLGDLINTDVKIKP